MKTVLVILSFIVLFIPLPVIAHSGRTDSSGGHNCSASSISKGLCTGYHYHNGGTPYTPSQQVVPVATPVVIATPKAIITTPKPTIRPTAKPTIKATPKVTPIATINPTVTPTPTVTPVVQSAPMETKKQGFFEWLFSLFF